MINSYLSGVNYHLQATYPHVIESQQHSLVVDTLRGVEKPEGQAIGQKKAFEDKHLLQMLRLIGAPRSYDESLFLAICFTAYHGLMRLGELVIPDDPAKVQFCKMILCQTVVFSNEHSSSYYKFQLPTHKGDKQYHSNEIVIQECSSDIDPLAMFKEYLQKRDEHFPFLLQLWLRENRSWPKCSWFTCKL